jgi:predicted Zn-dependent protease with MMP-like domain
MTTKLSSTQVAQLSKLAAVNLRALSTENVQLREANEELTVKVASFEKRARVEKIAAEMEAKGLNPGTSLQEKIAQLMQRDSLDSVEEAVGMAAPQMKIASVHEDGVEVESSGDAAQDLATQRFAAGIASIGE